MLFGRFFSWLECILSFMRFIRLFILFGNVFNWLLERFSEMRLDIVVYDWGKFFKVLLLKLKCFKVLLGVFVNNFFNLIVLL